MQVVSITRAGGAALHWNHEQHTGRIVKVHPSVWAGAWLLAMARVQSNDGARNESRDRGEAKNAINDLMGSFGELVAYAHFGLPPEARAHLAGHIFHPGGGANLPGLADLSVALAPSGGVERIDIKTFDLSDTKKHLFLINKSKHESLRGNCEHYLFASCARGATRVHISRLVPYADADRWSEPKKFKDPAIGLPATEFLLRYGGGASNAAALPRATYSTETLWRWTSSERTWMRLATAFPTLKAVDYAMVLARARAEWLLGGRPSTA